MKRESRNGGLFYCPKCGKTISGVSNNFKDKCKVCAARINPVPYGYGITLVEVETLIASGNKNSAEIFAKSKQRFFDEVISKEPEFDMDLYQRKDEIFAAKVQAEKKARERKIAEQKARAQRAQSQKKFSPDIMCPYCHSVDTEKISFWEKALGYALIGNYALSRNSKYWHCNDCGSDF